MFIFWIVAFPTFLITSIGDGPARADVPRGEGSLIARTHKVLGPFWGSPPALSLAAGADLSGVHRDPVRELLAAGLRVHQAELRGPCLFTENWQIGVVVLVVIWFSALMSYLKMRVTQNYVNVLFWFYAAAIFLIGFAGVWWLLQGNPASTDFGTGWDPFQGETLALGLPANLTFFSFAILALLGIETPLNMGAEVTGGEKAIRTFLLWGCAIVMAAYLWATWGNMVVIEAGGANGTTGGAETVGLSLGRWTGAAVALVMAWVVLTVAVVYNFSFGRLLFVSGMEKRLPHQFGKVNRNQVPANATAPERDLDDPRGRDLFVLSHRAKRTSYRYFYGLYAGVNIVWCISTALLFLDIFFAKRAEPERFERERRVPTGFLFLCSDRFVVNILAVLFIFVGSWYPVSDSNLTGWELADWNVFMVVFTLVSVVHHLVRVAVGETRQVGRGTDRRGTRRSRDRRRVLGLGLGTSAAARARAAAGPFSRP